MRSRSRVVCFAHQGVTESGQGSPSRSAPVAEDSPRGEFPRYATWSGMPTDRAVCPFEKDPMSSQAPGQMIAEPVEGGPPALPPVPSILMLAWPTIAGNLLYSVVGLVNTKIVGSLGASAVAAVTTGSSPASMRCRFDS